MIGILIMVVIYNVFRRRGRSRPKAAAFSIGIYYGVPVVITLLLVSVVSIGEYLPLVAPGVDRLVSMNSEPPQREPNTLSNPSQGKSARDMGGEVAGGTGPTTASYYESMILATHEVPRETPYLESARSTRPPEPRPLDGQIQSSFLDSYTRRDGCDPAYPDARTCVPPGPPFDQGCAITAERRFTVLPPDPQGLDADGDGIGCEPVR